MTRGTYEDWWRVGDRIEIDFNGRSYMATLTKCRAILTFTYEVDGSTEKIPPESLKERVLRKLPAIALVKGDARVSPVAKSKAGAARKGMAKKATAKSVQSKGKTKGAAAKGALRRSSRPRKKVSYVDDTKYDVEDSNSSSQSSASESEESESESEAYSTESEEEDNDDEDYDNLVDEGPRQRKKQTKSKTASSSSSSSSPSSASGGASESLILDLFGLSEKRRQEQNKFRNRNKKKRRDARPLLNQRGYAALAYDIRGSGGSTHLPEDYTHRAIYDDPEMAPHDLRAALSTLRNMDTVDAQRIAVVGASIGGNLAVVASAQFDVQAAVSISPKTSAVRNLAGRDSLSLSSVYYISSSLDQGGKRKAWVEELYGLTTAPKELDIVQGTGHGVYIFAEDPQLPDRIVAWLDTQLKKAASQP